MTGNFAFAGIDMALWDLCGKECGQPLYRMFGGAIREAVDYYYYMEWGPPEDDRGNAKDGVERGYRAYYIKVGVDERKEEAMLDAMRGAIGPRERSESMSTRPGPKPQAALLLKRWHERHELDFVEAPVPIDPVENYLELKGRIAVPLCVNEGLWREADAYRVIKSRCGDYLCYSSYWVGPPADGTRSIRCAIMEGWQVVKHTHGELGLTAAAGQHVMLAAPNAARATSRRRRSWRTTS